MKKKSTLGNKILAVCLLVLSAIPMIMEKEATGFIFVCMVAILSIPPQIEHLDRSN